ncbi:unnamed protein product [Phytomonas sp. EM1]|nr:unnamed protein product [Phytomonas sp. EM1]|eukprot:CCW62587.1 unnamed protein product [Phytomonas sp. isolate EM1]
MPHDVRIQRLSTEVINRIAAGEVVQRPSAALKELIENSLDAGCTCIQVVAQEGGLDVLQVSDDGHGIPYEDLPLLCERYATSKLRRFEDLQRISSFGFRGEALAALSFVSRVTATTRPRRGAPRGDASLAWRGRYIDGRLTGSPEPCAGNHGTTIRAEKMFYNTAIRRAALRPVEEWSRLVDVVSRYALAFPAIGFSCRKEAPSRASDGVSFPRGSTTLNNIRLSHGSGVSSNLRFIFHYDEELYEASKRSTGSFPNREPQGGDVGDVHDEGISSSATVSSSSMLASEAMGPSHDRKYREKEQAMERVRKVSEYVASLSGPMGEGVFTIMGYTSDTNLISRKGYFCLFVNQRLVESAAIRRVIDSVYASIPTGGNRPFTVLFVNVPPDRVDVNVHPTKTEVYLLDEELVIGRIAELIRVALLEAASERQVDLMSLGKSATLALQATARAADAAGKEASSSTMLSSSQAALHSLQRDVPMDRRRSGGVGVPTSSLPVATARVSDPRGTAVAPCTVVRVEPQKGALDAFFRSQPTQPPTGSSSEVVGVTARPDFGGATSSPLDVEPKREGCTATAGLDSGLVAGSTSQAPPTSDFHSAPPTHSASFFPQLDSDAPPHLPVDHDVETTSALPESSRKRVEGHGFLTYIEESVDDGTDDDDDSKIMLEFKKFRRDLSIQEVHVAASPSPPAIQADIASNEEQKDLVKDGRAHGEHVKTGSRGDPPKLADSSGPWLGATEQFNTEHSKAFSRSEVGQNLMTCGGRIGDDPTGVDAGGANPSHVVIAPELEDHVLTSVSVIAKEICYQTSTAVQNLIDGLSFVGIVDEDSFLAQYNTSLLLVRILPLVREIVYQRIFLRWAQSSLPNSPFLSFARPISVQEALLFALRHDTLGMVPPSQGLLKLLRVGVVDGRDPTDRSSGYAKRSDSEWIALIDRVASREEAMRGDLSKDRSSTHLGSTPFTTLGEGKQSLQHDSIEKSNPHNVDFRFEVEELMTAAPYLMWGSAKAEMATKKYVCSLVRRLSLWRDMLNDYFSIVLTDDAQHLMALPHGLNASWAPYLRAVPLFLWVLADAVPYPSPATPRSGDDEYPENTLGKSHFLQQEREIEAEIRCFTSIARHIADILYGLVVPVDEDSGNEGSSSCPDSAGAAVERDSCVTGNPSRPCSTTSASYSSMKTQGGAQNALEGGPTPLERLGNLIRFGLFPCMRNKKLFIPSADLLTNGDIQSVVTVETLYKVFERC